MYDVKCMICLIFKQKKSWFIIRWLFEIIRIDIDFYDENQQYFMFF